MPRGYITPVFPDEAAVSAWHLRLNPMFSGVFRTSLPIRRAPLMGDCQTELLRPQFDHRLRLEFHGAKLTSDAGLLAYRELDDAPNLTDSARPHLPDTATGR